MGGSVRPERWLRVFRKGGSLAPDWWLKVPRNNQHIDNNLKQWIDIDDYTKHYWVQEFSKNPDGAFSTSVYFIWNPNGVIKMGPVWDFDISCGGHNNVSRIYPENWYISLHSWNLYAFKDSILNQAKNDYWLSHKNEFERTIIVVDSIYTILEKSAQNNFRKWDILQSTELAFHHYSYNSYSEAVDDLKNWISKRIEWIDLQITQ